MKSSMNYQLLVFLFLLNIFCVVYNEYYLSGWGTRAKQSYVPAIDAHCMHTCTIYCHYHFSLSLHTSIQCTISVCVCVYITIRRPFILDLSIIRAAFVFEHSCAHINLVFISFRVGWLVAFFLYMRIQCSPGNGRQLFIDGT